jgi:hypothetical protein
LDRERNGVNISQEGRNIFKRYCLIALGIPSVLLVFVLVLYFSPWEIDQAQVSTSTLNVVAACFAAVGVAMWAFFSHLMYRRLWKVFPYIAERDKAWSYTEGVFGLLGVGVSLMSTLGVLYYLFTGDITRSIVLILLSFALALVEIARFPTRLEEVKKNIAEME